VQVEELGEKLAELEKDCADLKEYQQIDKQRRALEFNIYDADLTDTRNQLETVCAVEEAQNLLHTRCCLLLYAVSGLLQQVVTRRGHLCVVKSFLSVRSLRSSG
jgi:hypothetical protein